MRKWLLVLLVVPSLLACNTEKRKYLDCPGWVAKGDDNAPNVLCLAKLCAEYPDGEYGSMACKEALDHCDPPAGEVTLKICKTDVCALSKVKDKIDRAWSGKIDAACKLEE